MWRPARRNWGFREPLRWIGCLTGLFDVASSGGRRAFKYCENAEMNWTCPYCNRAQTVTDAKHSSGTDHIGIMGHSLESASIYWSAVGCANDDCNKLTIHAAAYRDKYVPNTGRYALNGEAVIFRRLLPEGAAKPQPAYIPVALREDYEEACLVRDFSPKAAATLARRCLQGMIRDFCGITKKRLIDEITALREAIADGTAPRDVSSDSVEAIDHVRTIGNIGAHMESDVNVIIPVEAEEAQVLIELIEMLFEEWYVERQTRRERLARIAAIASSKKPKPEVAAEVEIPTAKPA